MKKLALLCLLLLSAAMLMAQEESPKAEVMGGYSYFNASTGGSGLGRVNLNGWEAQGSVNVNRWIGFTADFSGNYGTVKVEGLGVNVHTYSYLFGPTFSYRTKSVTPFAHALFGANTLNGSALGASGGETGFAWGVGGGVDIPVHSVISIRAAQVDWLQTRHFSTTLNNVRVSTGVVFRFGS